MFHVHKFISLCICICIYNRNKHGDMYDELKAFLESKMNNEQQIMRQQKNQSTLPYVSALDPNKVSRLRFVIRSYITLVIFHSI